MSSDWCVYSAHAGAGQKLKDKFRLSSNVLHDRRFLNITTTLVKPITATVPTHHTIALSNLDRLFGFYYTPLILYYHNQTRASFSEIVERLKSSLSAVLVMFYPMAGRVIQSADLPAEIHCNDAGVVFTEAVIEAHLEELRMDDGYSPAPILSGIAAADIGPGPAVFSPSGSGLPSLIIQITRFLCGGYAIAINWLHKVADGLSGIHFVKAWARCSSREHDLFVEKLVFDRSILKPRSPPNPTIDVTPTVQVLEILNKDATGELQAAGADTNLQLPSFWIQEFCGQALQKLKSEATRDGEGPFSTADCLSAHLWKCLTRARSLSPEEMTNFVVHVEGRKKINPPLPHQYFGNAVCVQFVSATVGDLLSKPLSFGANLIRRAIQKATDEFYRSLIDWVQLQPPSASTHIIGSQIQCATTDLALSSWASFPVYEIDFGWQKPDFAVRNGSSIKHMNGLWYLFPSPAGKHQRTLLINLQADILATLLEDPEFYVL